MEKDKKVKRDIYTFTSNAAWHWKEQFRREPNMAVAVLALSVIAVALPLLNARLPKQVLRGLEEHLELKQLVLQVGILILILAAGSMVKSALDAYIKRMQGPFEDDFNLRMLKKRLYVDYDVLESKKFNDDAHAVFDSLYRNNSVLRDGSMIWQRFLTAVAGLVLYSAILLRQSIVAVLLVWVPAMLILRLKERAATYDRKLRPEADKASRKMKYVEECACDLAGGEDIRMYGLAGWLLSILHKEQTTADRYVERWENGYFAVNICDAILCFIRDFGIYLYFIWKIINGDMAISDFVWYTAIAASCQEACSALIDSREKLGRLSFDYSRLRQFLSSWEESAFHGTNHEKDELIQENSSVADETAHAADKTDAVEIRLEHVGFTYPGSAKPTIKDVNVTLHPGEKIALVGLNGAGKSTLVKLLCGLYRPTQGTIYINGRPQADYTKEEYFSLLAVVFQDVKLLPMTIAQNVASDIGTHIDHERVRECLELTGLWKKVSTFPKREDTPLGESILDDGIALSGGENQKLWMARALYKNAPMLLLDEPTAALDPLAEQQIYQKYMEMVEGRTSVFISHRLASTHFCDRILLLEGGTIIEQGTHEELIRKKGRYAQLFEIQGKYYRENKTRAEDDSEDLINPMQNKLQVEEVRA